MTVFPHLFLILIVIKKSNICFIHFNNFAIYIHPVKILTLFDNSEIMFSVEKAELTV